MVVSGVGLPLYAKVHIIVSQMHTHVPQRIFTCNLFSFLAASQCPKLDDPKNGRVKMMNGRTVGSEVWYICDAGFVLIGMEARTCLSSLEWSSEAPICQRKIAANLKLL